MPALSARGLVKRIGRQTIVDGVDLEVAGAQIVGLLGANGAGKTTTFGLLIGLARPTAGRIALGGDDITPLPMHARARRGIGYLPQEHSVFRKLSVEDNLLAVLEAAGGHTAAERRAIAGRLLEEFGVARLRERPAIQLSGGEKRRVEIARALALGPAFMLLDEPFAGIDPLAVRDIRAHIAGLKARGIGVLITDHNVRETLDICDRAYILHRGAVLAAGTPQEILDNASVRAAYLGHDFRM